MILDILCKVVDNYGDIGVAYRLARALSELDPHPTLRIVVDDLRTFSLLEPLVRPGVAVQTVRGWTIVDWKGPGKANGDRCAAVYGSAGPRVVLECFACGRPDWFESMLFDGAMGAKRTIVNLEYLSAQPYAEEFHRMPSLTRSPLVRKHMFMPGFTPGTGGLILDPAFVAARERCADPAQRVEERRKLLAGAGFGAAAASGIPADKAIGLFWVMVFAYERDYARVVADLASFNATRPVLALVASGKSEPCFMRAWERAGRPFPVLKLSFHPQETWDRLLLAADFLIVRGEDSMARAALSGKPFLWHAYPQAEAHQLVKVRALLDRMRPYFDTQYFPEVEKAFLAFNERFADGPGTSGNENMMPLLEASVQPADSGLKEGFKRFADGLLANGNLAANLMTFLNEIV